MAQSTMGLLSDILDFSQGKFSMCIEYQIVDIHLSHIFIEG